jgi:5-dehydro-2-deoxygluconokinase
MGVRVYDTLHMGRSSIDLYSNDIGVPFAEIKSFAAYVGGCPTNMAVGAQRLGLKTALLTGIGDDPVADFILHFLEENGVDTSCVFRKPGYRTSAVLLGVNPPGGFQLVFYRDRCADLQLTVDDALCAPISESRVLQVAGTNLTAEPSRSATVFAMQLARRAGTKVVFDLDFRPNRWHDSRAYGATIRSALALVDVAIGTRDELNAAVRLDPVPVDVPDSHESDTPVDGDIDWAVEELLRAGPSVVVQKRGALGACVHCDDGSVYEVPGFDAEILNIMGAGDAFAAGLLYGYVKGWDWYRAARLGNACGAILVTKHGCANFMPTFDEVVAFADAQGGL